MPEVEQIKFLPCLLDIAVVQLRAKEFCIDSNDRLGQKGLLDLKDNFKARSGSSRPCPIEF